MKNCILALIALLSLAASVPAAPAPKDARHVIHRGARRLVEALATVTGDAWRDPARTRPVAIVIDVTPNTKAAAPRLRTALDDLGDRVRHLRGAWSIAPLGGSLTRPVRHPSALTFSLDRVLAKETPVRSTIRALARTLRTFERSGGIVVYLADWRFEDDEGLEPFIAGLARRGQSLRVIGSEAAHGRPWTEPFYPEVKEHPRQRFATGIGRCPFHCLDPESPWHGGDTAYPHVPWHVGRPNWQMTFPLRWGELSDESDVGVTEDPEELSDRVRREEREDAVAFAYPLASGWGPYGLMRACAVTRGTYMLFSWNPRGRKNVEYDYGLCNLFPPDLRSRRAILADIARRPLPRAMMQAWHLLAAPGRGLTAITPPVDDDCRRPRPMDHSVGGGGCGSCGWRSRNDHEMFLRHAAANLRALDEALRVLDAALARPEERDGVSPRYRADADHFRHIVATQRFQWAEAMEAARTVSPRAWDDPDVRPGLEPLTWIAEADEPERIRVVANVTPHDLDAAEDIATRHLALMRRYARTPIGVIVSRNSIATWRVIYEKCRDGDDDPGGRAARTPSESEPTGATSPRPRPPAASGGSGGSTGR